MAHSAEPELYDLDADGTPALRGAICSACGYVMFPRQHFGCERCGAFGDALQSTRLSGRGAVRAGVTVFRHDPKDLPAPFVLAEVRLDEGPVVRGVCVGDRTPDGGTRVAVAGAAAVADPDGVELRFVVEAEA